MKKLLILMIFLIALCPHAQAETYVYSSDQAPAVYFECEDFDRQIPPALSGAFDGCLQAGDEILCGAAYDTRYRSGGETERGKEALLALRRDGKILLAGARETENGWRCAVETDSFFAPGQPFDLTVLPWHNMEGAFNGVNLAIVCGGEEFLVSVNMDGCVLLEQYQVPWADGSTLSIRVGMGSLYASRYLDGILQESKSADGVISMRLCGWTYDDFPKSCAQVGAWEGRGMPEFSEDEAFIFGVNLREKPTGQSRSLGKYTTAVRVLDQKEGKQAPWYQVQFGDKTGWVSGVYVLWPKNERHLSEIAMYLSQMLYP